MYGMKIKEENYFQLDTVTEVLKTARDWDSKEPDKGKKIVHGHLLFLAGLSTDFENGEL